MKGSNSFLGIRYSKQDQCLSHKALERLSEPYLFSDLNLKQDLQVIIFNENLVISVNYILFIMLNVIFFKGIHIDSLV